MNNLILSEEVLMAINGKKPILALESTVITHGLPKPQNLKTAQAMEEAVRNESVVPATICILKR